jgi:hypothetical protein
LLDLLAQACVGLGRDADAMVGGLIEPIELPKLERSYRKVIEAAKNCS